MKNAILLIIIRAYAGIAQLVEHLIRNEGVAGSNPVSGTTLRVFNAMCGRPPKQKDLFYIKKPAFAGIFLTSLFGFIFI